MEGSLDLRERRHGGQKELSMEAQKRGSILEK